MSKRQEKREEEKRIIAEMESALQEEKTAKTEAKREEKPRSSYYSSTQPERIHCHRCKTLMENGVCPTCGYKIYVPMSDEKRNKIKTVTTAIGFVVFIVIFLIIQFSKS